MQGFVIVHNFLNKSSNHFSFRNINYLTKKKTSKSTCTFAEVFYPWDGCNLRLRLKCKRVRSDTCLVYRLTIYVDSRLTNIAQNNQ